MFPDDDIAIAFAFRICGHDGFCLALAVLSYFDAVDTVDPYPGFPTNIECAIVRNEIDRMKHRIPVSGSVLS